MGEYRLPRISLETAICTSQLPFAEWIHAPVLRQREAARLLRTNHLLQILNIYPYLLQPPPPSWSIVLTATALPHPPT